MYGDFPAIDQILKKSIVEGRFLNEHDIEKQRKVCVIGMDTYKLLYKKNENPIGTYIKINGVYFQVVGYYEEKEGFGNDNTVLVPFTTFQKAFNSGSRVGWLAIDIKKGNDASKALGKIKGLLSQKYIIHPKDERALGSFNLAEKFEKVNGFTLVLQGFSFFIGIFTMLAGVIAISNILLITVKERTKEIGIRRALGATPAIIKKQIIYEAVTLTVFSGLIGFTLGVGILYILDISLSDGEFPFVNPTVSLPQVILSFGLMLVLSLVVGLIPANRAVKIKPIEALREE